MVQLHIMVSGKVQGVGYRYFAQMKAVQYGIKGWVRNSDDNSVEIVAVGEQEQVDQFVKVLREGNPFSKVTNVEISQLEESSSFQSFKIKY
ncbi:acylphosphatase [Cytobacillus sp. FJAT-54145]|uniref:acylphosphatase n=1 Tax=Cytobacillus spartinae TaxID=3299023 RepID=A0ABW6KB29_9BACI